MPTEEALKVVAEIEETTRRVYFPTDRTNIATIIDSALDAARSEVKAQDAGIARSREWSSTVTGYDIAQAILATSPDPAFTQRIEDAAYEDAAGTCQEQQVGPGEYMEWQTTWESLSKREVSNSTAVICADMIRALKSTEGK